MTPSSIFMFIILLASIAFIVVHQRSLAISKNKRQKLHSLPRHYGYFAATCALLPGIFVLAIWLVFSSSTLDGIIINQLSTHMTIETDVQAQLLINRVKMVMDTATQLETDPNVIAAASEYLRLEGMGRYATLFFALGLGCLGMGYAYLKTGVEFRARNKFEKILMIILAFCSGIAIFTTLGIVLSLLFESIRFFKEVPLYDFLTGLQWSPQTALRGDQVASSGSFGAVPLFAGTLMISLIAMTVAVPVGLLAAIYMTQYASKRLRKITKPILEILAGVPTVVYGFFAALVIAPAFKDFGDLIGLPIDSHSALAAGFVMGIMIIPFISSLSDDAITAVPQSLKDGSMALGATKSETIKKVIIPAALPGIIGAILLAVSRAIGETMIVVMAAGMQANLTANPMESVTTVTVQIVKLLTGDQEFDSAKTLSAFALGLVLFVATLFLNILAQRTVRKYREAYD
ncbi:phosphate ABC transporter permease subunit PstC [Temperatibacter marinus]|uniref:Phosphate transport system permease protein n=1 Tax=Temperatibacter marinus TaxID=1456591 RepID=A0AA52HAC3_9PROT|nr:phosphate ABC transporter permease subunit PstC [Temperatibacter marinus]WND03472.1 phosphate ABC transporter permease subunit PstC [Temperatibacter marinus]